MDILEDGYAGITLDLFEDGPSHEVALVAIRQQKPGRADPDNEFEQVTIPAFLGESEPKGPSDRGTLFERLENLEG